MERNEPRMNTLDELTTCERIVAKLVAHGLTNKEIANRMRNSERTVRTHVSNIFPKLHTRNRTELALYVVKAGWVELDDIELPRMS